MLELTGSQITLLLIAIGAIAFLYSSVGHGGATGYLAIMGLVGVAPAIARPGALWMNCCVASIAFWRFYRAGYFDARTFLPLAIASIPMAWLGSRLHLSGRPGAVVLGLTLVAAGWSLGWGSREEGEAGLRPAWTSVLVLAGAALGFLAGLTGIGGGVFLTPLLILLHWSRTKTAGGVSAAFIVVNSSAGLLGLGRQALIGQPALLAGPAVAIAGAFAGTYLGVRRWRNATFRRALAVVLWIAAAKLLLTTKG